MVEAGFIKADSRNLPKIDMFMVVEFITSDDRFNAAEIRLVKASLSSRESYGNNAIGYVCLKKEGLKYTIKGKITTEHRVRNKNYAVKAVVDTDNEKIEDISCEDCAASLGGCKHSLAFLMWLYRKSEQESPTEVECYWNKPVLASVGSSSKILTVSDMCQKPVRPENLPDNSEFFKRILRIAEEKQIDCQLTRHNFLLKKREPYKLSLHELTIDFLKTGKTSAEDFLTFAKLQYTESMCKRIEKETKDQSDNVLWHEMRYGRITASTIYEAAHCKKEDGSLIRKILGASKKFDTIFMKRGRNLESSVVSEIEKRLQLVLKKSGFMLMPSFPMFGASADAVGPDFVCEVKCPSSVKNVKNYIKNGLITEKFNAQIQLQMLASNKKKGLFCVADPDFENNKLFDLIWIDYDDQCIKLLLNQATKFWMDNIFC